MAIITLAEAKTHIGITGTSEDTSLQQIVDAVNVFVGTYCHRTFESATYTEELYDGSGGPELVLKNYPIITITEILVDTEEVDERTDVGEEGYYIKNANNGILYNNAGWSRGRGNIQITYTAGYATVPNDLKYACLAMAAYFRNMKGKDGIMSESLGSYAYSIASGLNNMLGELTIPSVIIKNILDRYKKIINYMVF